MSLDAKAIKTAVTLARKSRSNYEYFFSKLSSAAWIQPLQENGFFREPPAAERGEGFVRYQEWPESQYIARVAADAPQAALKLMLTVPETDNERIHEDFTDAACAMPVPLASQWALKETEWVRQQDELHMLSPKKLCDLISHLLVGNEITAALGLVEALFLPLPESRTVQTIGDESQGTPVWRIPPGVRGRFDDWWYGESLRDLSPRIAEHSNLDGLRTLIILLRTAVSLIRFPEEEATPEDHSHAWRPAIADHEQNSSHSIEDHLVNAVRDVAESVIGRNGENVLALLEDEEYLIFRRIALFLRHRHFNVDPDGTSAIVSKSENLSNPYYRHELFHLLKDRFDQLQPSARSAYLAWVDTGPPGRMHNESEKLWQYRRLLPIQAYLKGEWLQKFLEMANEIGEIEHPDFQFYSKSFVGPTSPKSAEDLSSMGIPGIVEFLKDWKPGEGLMADSAEGLGRQLSAVVQKRVQDFADCADQFQLSEPAYVRAVLSAFADALNQNKKFNWPKVIELCQWAIAPHEDIPEECSESDGDIAVTWRNVRKAVADLFANAYEPCPGSLPFDLRDSGWLLTRGLTDDDEPTPEYEAQCDGSNLDPATMALNTVRPRAIQAAMKYALWVRRNLEGEDVAAQNNRSWFREMPEVQKLLEKHLDIAKDPSLTVRSIYGKYFPWFVTLDEAWTKKQVDSIFPEANDLASFWAAAWDTYVTYCSVYPGVVRVLVNTYRQAIAEIGTAKARKTLASRNPHERLAEHLTVIYLHDVLETDDSFGLLKGFFANAATELRQYAIGYVGRHLHNRRIDVTSEMRQRLRDLWSWRISECTEDGRLEGEELTGFGWWFVSGKLDDAWAIEQLIILLKSTGSLETMHQVIERLAELANEHPAPVLESLELIAEADKGAGGLHWWRQHFTVALERLVRSNDNSIQDKAISLVHRIGAMGYLDFRGVLPTTDTE